MSDDSGHVPLVFSAFPRRFVYLTLGHAAACSRIPDDCYVAVAS
jgi:hypothetical protein